MSAPLVVNTTDGMCWTRREATRDGQALFALEAVGDCPEHLMETYAELVERGIVGSADVLPVPVGPVPQVDPVAAARRLDLLGLMDERAASVVSPLLAAVLGEAERLRARVAGLEAAPRTVFRASHESIVMDLYTTAAEARKHCETELLREWPTSVLDWIEDEENGIAELVAKSAGGQETETGYVVTALEVAAAFDEEAEG